MTSTQDVIEAVVDPQVDGQEQIIDSKDENIRNMRQLIKDNQLIIARQNQQLEEMNQRFSAVAQPIHQQTEEDYFAGLDEEDAFEVKQAKQIVPKEVDKAVRKVLAERDKAQDAIKNRAQKAYETAKKAYDDFDEVMAKDNVDSIITNVPAVYRVVSTSEDPIDAAYHLIKNSAAYDKKKNSRTSNMVEKAKLQENLKKPKTPDGVSPTSNISANVNAEAGTFSRLSKAQQKELWTDHNKRLGRRQ